MVLSYEHISFWDSDLHNCWAEVQDKVIEGFTRVGEIMVGKKGTVNVSTVLEEEGGCTVLLVFTKS